MTLRVGLLLLIATAAVGLVAAERGAAPADSEQRVLRGVRPAFRILPLVQEFSGRPGQRIPFFFDVQSLGKTTRLQIRLVDLRQEENGLILPDDNGPVPTNVSLAGPGELTLQPGERSRIRGMLTVPLDPAAYHAYGLLVTDLGQSAEAASETDDAGSLRVKFVTRYLLRLGLAVPLRSAEQVDSLQIIAAQVASKDGRPAAQVLVQNLGKNPTRFQLRCHLVRKGGQPAGRPFLLGLPIRERQQGPQRYVNDVLGGARVRLEGPIDAPLFSGEYKLVAEVLTDRIPRLKEHFPVTIRDEDFPAQSAEVAQVGEALHVSPAQLKLSLQAHGDRLVPLRFANNGRDPLLVQLRTLPWRDDVDRWLVVQPRQFELLPGKSRNVLVALRSPGTLDQHQYGKLGVAAQTLDGRTVADRDLPVALLTRAQTTPQYQLGPVSWLSEAGKLGLVSTIQNQGQRHLELSGRLSLVDQFGRSSELQGGFGQWLLPGESGDIHFHVPGTLPPGTYEARMEIEPGYGDTPKIVEQLLVIPGQ